MEIVEYMKGKAPLEIREEKLFELVNEIEKETNDLFSEVTSTNKESLFKIMSLLVKCRLLSDKYKQIYDSFSYISEIEVSSYYYASKRYELKMLLTTMISVYAFMADAILGIASYVALSTSAKNYFLYELNYINENMKRFDDSRIKRIGTTLDSSKRIINGKKDRLVDIIKTDPVMRDRIILENRFILELLEGSKGLEDFYTLPNEVHNGIINILKDDLNYDSNDINVLYDILIQDKNDKETKKLLK